MTHVAVGKNVASSRHLVGRRLTPADAPPFEWDPVRAAANFAKHGVSLEEAATAFEARIHADPDPSASESREILIGHSAKGRLFAWRSPTDWVGCV